jgi:ubiquinone/menaquinone biosynthesis C-methylase UbiE
VTNVDFYSRVIFPRLCDFVLDRPFVAKHRRELLSTVDGEVLEIGFGTGLNLAYYPEHVRKITVVDPSSGMQRQARSRIDRVGIKVEQRLLSSEELPFDDQMFDCVVSTFTLCSIEDVGRALSEVYRVLKPGGRFLFLEHGLSSDVKVQKWQRQLNWLQRYLAGNCRLDRNVRDLVRQEPFGYIDIDEFYLEQTPRTHGYISKGMARR